MNFWLTFAPYVRHTYVTATSVCAALFIDVCESQKSWEARLFAEHFFSPISHEAFACDRRKRGEEEEEEEEAERSIARMARS